MCTHVHTHTHTHTFGYNLPDLCLSESPTLQQIINNFEYEIYVLL